LTETASDALPFWKRLSLEQMSAGEWESLCDGCASCCLNKLEDEDTGEIAWTAIRCRLLEADTCRCSDYQHRSQHVPDCIQLTPQNARTISWLPPTCAYRLIAEGRDLYWWHPLVSGDPETVHQAGISVRGHIVLWPARESGAESVKSGPQDAPRKATETKA
jgi:uncharacterized cysteine cluster protein YcgN (CxxCxxCC family)